MFCGGINLAFQAQSLFLSFKRLLKLRILKNGKLKTLSKKKTGPASLGARFLLNDGKEKSLGLFCSCYYYIFSLWANT